ncbi:MAG: hypothetical protein RR022_08065 [Angelakisella sp.]
MEQAAAAAYLKPELLRHIEEESDFNTKEIGSEQIACLAYQYDVDLYWVFSGKARPPAAILKDRAKLYPPYEFMLEQAPMPPLVSPSHAAPDAADGQHLTADEIDLLDSYSYVDQKHREEVHTFIGYLLNRTKNLSSSSSLESANDGQKLA